MSIFSAKSDDFKVRLRFSQYLIPFYIALDLLLVGTIDQQFQLSFSPIKHFEIGHVSPFIWLGAPYLLSILITKPYHNYRLWSLYELAKKFLIQQIVFLGVLYAIIGLTKITKPTNSELLTYVVTLILLLSAVRLSIYLFLRNYRKWGYNYRNIVLLGNDHHTQTLANYINNRPSLGYKLKAQFAAKNTDGLDGNIDDFKTLCQTSDIHEVFLSAESIQKKYVKDIVRFAENLFISVKIIPFYSNISERNVKVLDMGSVPVISVTNIPFENKLNAYTKRTFDILFSGLVMLTLLWWLIPLLGIIIKLESPGPMLFMQWRSGLNNRPFKCLKMRTMRVNKESGTKQAAKHDDRITRFGAFLRKTSLDEFPQFINVFLGHMSIVGPRPHMIKHTEEYAKIIDRYMVRHFIKPGITGLSQVRGYRGGTENPRLMKNRIRLDIFYIEKWSFLLDTKIILQTFFNMLRGEKNAY